MRRVSDLAAAGERASHQAATSTVWLWPQEEAEEESGWWQGAF